MSAREVILLVAMLVLAASNLVLLMLLHSYLSKREVAPPPQRVEKPAEPGKEPSSPSTAAGPPGASAPLNVSSGSGGGAGAPPVNVSIGYVEAPVTYYLSIEAVSSFELDAGGAPRIPENLSLSVVKLEGSPLMCAVDVKAGVVAGVATVNVTIPLPGGCYRVEPVLMNRTASEVYFRLALVEDPAGACGRCARITLIVSHLPPGRYVVYVGPVLRRGS